MVITYHGGQFVKITFANTTLAFNPISKQSSLKPTKFGADIALVSMWHPDFNGVKEVTRNGSEPFLIDGPGAYEIDEITVRGFGVPVKYEGVDRYNTIYQVQLEGMNIVFLGALADSNIDSSILGALGDIDILFVPIGDGDVLSVPEASKLGVKLEAKCVIPIQYDKKTLEAFLKEESAESVKPVDKLTLKHKDVSAMEGEIAVLSS